MKGEAGMPPEPLDDLRVLVGGVVVQHDMDLLGGGHFAFDGVQETDELLVPMTLPSSTFSAANRVVVPFLL